MEKAKVLLVDDDRDFVETGRIALEASGKYEVIAAYSTQEGLQKVKQENPDAVVVDLFMEKPDSGIELVRNLRSQRSDVPIMVLTSNSGPVRYAELSEEVRELGVSRCVKKPVQPGQFSNLVGRLLNPAFYELEPMAYEM
jgi:two-component system nitrogen regulation response regulator NtrX